MGYNIKVYKFIRSNGGWENWEMVKIASVWDKSTKSLFQIEEDYKNQYKPTLNTFRAYITEEQKKEYEKEYYQNNIEHKLKYHKERYEKNKDRILEKQKEKFTCDCGSTLRKIDRTKHYKSKKHKSFIENN
jgi:hypothetical protein